ncbi:MAG: hypothetical protein A2220_11120 [Ignavibacteria bacterium RIFOXYA2_FULL_35_10]|nr:MAG: hypothetical protein A2220_11120 [Ignavibacteria bacterium RIFOXYA2_FULL_35_10]
MDENQNQNTKSDEEEVNNGQKPKFVPILKECWLKRLCKCIQSNNGISGLLIGIIGNIIGIIGIILAALGLGYAIDQKSQNISLKIEKLELNNIIKITENVLSIYENNAIKSTQFLDSIKQATTNPQIRERVKNMRVLT